LHNVPFHHFLQSNLDDRALGRGHVRCSDTNELIDQRA